MANIISRLFVRRLLLRQPRPQGFSLEKWEEPWERGCHYARPDWLAAVFIKFIPSSEIV